MSIVDLGGDSLAVDPVGAERVSGGSTSVEVLPRESGRAPSRVAWRTRVVAGWGRSVRAHVGRAATTEAGPSATEGNVSDRPPGWTALNTVPRHRPGTNDPHRTKPASRNGAEPTSRNGAEPTSRNGAEPARLHAPVTTPEEPDDGWNDVAHRVPPRTSAPSGTARRTP
jgi:hypothetical protein